MVKFLIGIIIIFLAIFGIWFFFFKSEEVQKVAKSGPIIFFGDSLTAGVGAAKGEDFPSLVAAELGRTDVINAGVSGDTTASALVRLQSDVLDKNPSLVVVELSGNDFLRQVPPEETIKNLDSIVRQIRNTGSAVILVHIKFPRNSATYEEGFRKIANKYKIKVIWNTLDGIIGTPSLMADEIHPNAAGYKIVAQRISKVLKEML